MSGKRIIVTRVWAARFPTIGEHVKVEANIFLGASTTLAILVKKALLK